MSAERDETKLDTLEDVRAEMKRVYDLAKAGTIDSATGVNLTRILKAVQEVSQEIVRDEVWQIFLEGKRIGAEREAKRAAQQQQLSANFQVIEAKRE